MFFPPYEPNERIHIRTKIIPLTILTAFMFVQTRTLAFSLFPDNNQLRILTEVVLRYTASNTAGPSNPKENKPRDFIDYNPDHN